MRRVTDRVSAVDQARRVRSVRVGRVLLEQGWLRESTPRGRTREGTIVNRFGVPPQFDLPPPLREREPTTGILPPPERERLPTV